MTDQSIYARLPFSEETFQVELTRLTEMLPAERRLAEPSADEWDSIPEYDVRRPVEGYGLRLAAHFTQKTSSKNGLLRFVRELDNKLLREDLGEWFGYAPFTPAQVTELMRLTLAADNQSNGGDLSRATVISHLIRFQRDNMFRPAPAAEVPTPEENIRVHEFQVEFARQGVFPWPHIIWLMTKLIPEGFISPNDYVSLFSTAEEQERSAEAYAMGCTTLDEVRAYDSLPKFIKEEMREEAVKRPPL